MRPRTSGRPKRWIAKPPRPRHLDAARHLAGQALKILEMIPPGMAKKVAGELWLSKIDIERSLSLPLRYVSTGPRTTIGLLPIRPPLPRREDHRQMAAQLLREARRQPHHQVAPPGPGRPGYVKEIVVKYRFRPIPYGAQLIGGRVSTSLDVFAMFRNLRYELREHIMIVHLDAANKVISVDHAATGAPNECNFSSSVVFRNAMLAGAFGIIIVHNHPSGVAEPSRGDLALMDEAKRTGELVRVPVTDFIIIGDDRCWSASDHQVLHGAPGMIPAPLNIGPKKNRARPGKRNTAASPARKGKPRSAASGT